MQPVLSVAVASYNVEKYLEKGLSSFADERFNNRLQVIVVNDGSTDSTLEIAKEYAEKYPHIFEVIDKPNGGHGSAVNAGIAAAKGKYFRIIDGDDWVNASDFARLLDKLEETDADLVVDQKREVNMETGATEFFPLPKVDTNKVLKFSDVCLQMDIASSIMIHTMSVRTSLLKANNIRLLEGIFYVDIEFVIKSTAKAKTIVFYDLEIYQYLVGNVNQSVFYGNYVKRFSHHSQVTRELVTFYEDYVGLDVIKEYLKIRTQLLINTHMNISLIYNENRSEGLKWTKQFRTWLKVNSPELYKITIKRYCLTLALHYLGVDYSKLQKLK